MPGSENYVKCQGDVPRPPPFDLENYASYKHKLDIYRKLMTILAQQKNNFWNRLKNDVTAKCNVIEDFSINGKGRAGPPLDLEN